MITVFIDNYNNIINKAPYGRNFRSTGAWKIDLAAYRLKCDVGLNRVTHKFWHGTPLIMYGHFWSIS